MYKTITRIIKITFHYYHFYIQKQHGNQTLLNTVSKINFVQYKIFIIDVVFLFEESLIY